MWMLTRHGCPLGRACMLPQQLTPRELLFRPFAALPRLQFLYTTRSLGPPAFVFPPQRAHAVRDAPQRHERGSLQLLARQPRVPRGERGWSSLFLLHLMLLLILLLLSRSSHEYHRVSGQSRPACFVLASAIHCFAAAVATAAVTQQP